MKLHGAYGRKYTDKESIIKDWKDGKDFKIIGGPYCSKRDFNCLDYVDSFSLHGEFYLLVSSAV